MLTIKNPARRVSKVKSDTAQINGAHQRRALKAASTLPRLANPKHEGEYRHAVKTQFWPMLRRVAARIPFAKEAAAAYFALRDPITPKRNKLLLLAALAYFVTPVDAIPDFLLTLGFTDDAAVFWAAWALVRDTIKEEHLEKAATALTELQRNDHPD